jgi:uncharacterized protein YkwD
MPAFRRALMPSLLAASFLLPAALPVAATTAASPSVTSAESAALIYANRERTSRGLVALRLDPRVLTVADGRAQVMAQTDVLSHDQADGTNVFDILSANGIKWYGGGEIIAWNQVTNLTSSAKGAVSQWMHSSGHRAILLSRAYNYVAFGVAVSPNSGKRYWAGVFIKGPDRTGAWTRLSSMAKSVTSATRTRVTFHWTGGDVQLQVLTSGLRYFQFQRRIAGGEWLTSSVTGATTYSVSWARGSTYEFRVRAVDRVGNWGPWRGITVRL